MKLFNLFNLFKKTPEFKAELTEGQFIDRVANALIDDAYGGNVQDEYAYLRTQIKPLEYETKSLTGEFYSYKTFLIGQLPEAIAKRQQEQKEFEDMLASGDIDMTKVMAETPEGYKRGRKPW